MEVILENRTVYSLEEYLIQLKNALSKQKKNIWQMIQKKVSKLFIKSQLCEFSYPDLIAFLEHCNSFIEIGQDFSNSSSKIMRESILQLLKEYYTTFHEKNLTSIRFFIANERWRRLPLPRNYMDPKLLSLLSNFPDDFSRLSALFGSQKETMDYNNMSLDDIIKKNSALSSFSKSNFLVPFSIYIISKK